MPKTIEMHTDRMKLADRILQLRIERGWSQYELAIRLNGACQPTVSLWENGKNMPTLIMAVRMAKVFGIKLDELTKGVDW
jgi:transcriptional regulator with XRE-family HTH domain